MNYNFLAPRQVIFGWGRRRELASLVTPLGSRVWLVVGSKTLLNAGVIDQFVDQLRVNGLSVTAFAAPAHEPLVEDVDQLVANWQSADCQHDRPVVVAVGGGSTIDLAKAAGALVTQPEITSVKDYLEGVGTGQQITTAPLPFVAVPTTAGTGAEATKNAVISQKTPAFKKSLRSNQMMPAAVLIDPELTVSVPPSITAATGMDALTQCVESYISCRKAPLPQALARQGFQLALSHLETAFQEGSNRPAREAMSHAAFLSGMALANSGLGLAHGVAAALGIEADIPHGLACAVMLPTALKFNREACLTELATLARDVLPSEVVNSAISPEDLADQLIARIDQLGQTLGIPRSLQELGVSRELIPALVKGSQGNSLSGNPRSVSPDELHQLLESHWS